MNGDIMSKWHYSTGCKIRVTLIKVTPYSIHTMLSHIPSIRDGKEALYWLVLCVNLTQAGVITEKGASVGEVPP